MIEEELSLETRVHIDLTSVNVNQNASMQARVASWSEEQGASPDRPRFIVTTQPR
jgi:hypothetical protein